jgi:hypothetical protein
VKEVAMANEEKKGEDIVERLKKKINEPARCLQEFENLNKQKTGENSFSIDVNSIKKQLADEFDRSTLDRIHSFDDDHKLRERFGIQANDSFAVKKEKLAKLEKEGIITVSHRNEFNNTFEKTVLLSNLGVLVNAIDILFADGVGKAVALLMEVLTLSYLSQQEIATNRRYSLEFYTTNGNGITFYFIDLAVTKKQVSTWFPLWSTQKEYVEVQILNIIGLTAAL